MKLLAIMVAIGSLCQSAAAQTPDCKSISSPGTRLACYDKAAPPVAASETGESAQRSGPVSKIDTAKYVDQISAEDALMNARLKSICRGC